MVPREECTKHRQLTHFQNAQTFPLIQLYQLLSPHHTYITIQTDDKESEDIPILNLQVLQILCHEGRLDFFKMLEKMTMIHDMVKKNGRH